jgi:hypothetical protein
VRCNAEKSTGKLSAIMLGEEDVSISLLKSSSVELKAKHGFVRIKRNEQPPAAKGKDKIEIEGKTPQQPPAAKRKLRSAVQTRKRTATYGSLQLSICSNTLTFPNAFPP